MRRLGLGLMAALLALGMAWSAAAQAPVADPAGLSPEQRAAVLQLLRQALREDPTILREALAALDEADRRERQEAGRAAIAQHSAALFGDAADPSKGNPRGDVTIVEFFDARCGYCKQMHPAMEALLARDRNVRLVLKDLPVLGPGSVVAARALLASQRQGRYPQFHDALMALRGEPTEAVLRTQAERSGLDWARLRRDMDDPAVQRRIDANLQLAQALGIDGTPSLVVGRTLVPGAIDLPALERLVAEARAGR